jgi:hypothetical protein
MIDAIFGDRTNASSERVLLALTAIAALAWALLQAKHTYFTDGQIPVDMGAYYCGGQAMLQGADPYRLQPLLTCEQALVGPHQIEVTPVAAPGYALAPFAALAALPLQIAAPLFAFTILAAATVTAFAVSRMTPIPFAAAFAIVIFGATCDSLLLGQPVPVAIAALTVAALQLRLGRPRRAASAAVLAMIQPQIGLPVLLVMFVFLPRTRIVLLTSGVALALLNVAVLGFSRTLEYFSALNIHVRAETPYVYQYSLTALLHNFGTPSDLALAIGKFSYLAGIAFSLLIVGMRRERAVESGALVFLPAVFAVTGGSYVHSQQIAVALIAAIVLLRPSQFAISLAIAALALPWVTHFSEGANDFTQLLRLPIELAAIWCLLFYTSRAARERFPKRTATLCTGAVLAYFGLLSELRPHFSGVPPPAILHDPSSLASFEYIQVVADWAARNHSTEPFFFAMRLPMWLALGCIAYFSSRALLASAPFAWPTRRISP